MELSISVSDGSKLEFLVGIPEGMENYALPGVVAVSAVAPFGKMLFHEFKGGEFTIVCTHYVIDTTVTIEAQMDQPVMEFQLACKNAAVFHRKGIGRINMLEKQFNVFYTPDWETSCELKENNEYTTLVVTFNVTYLQKLAPHFPFLEHFLDDAEKGKPGILTGLYNYANIQMMGVTHDILNGHFSEEVKNLYVEAKVMVLIIQALDKMGNTQDSGSNRIVLRPYDIEKIRESAELLLQHMERPLTIVELARRVGLNDYKLKKGFKQVFGTTIFGYFMSARMDRAKVLLQDTSIPIMDIAYMTGYRNMSNFITAFRRNFGGSPGSMRKR